jgi:hypothetical protein
MRTLLRISGWMILAVLAASHASAVPLSTGFTYQGQLIQSGNPFNGTAHLRFSLWDAAGSGSPPVGCCQIGGTQIVPNVPVTNGLFTVQVNGGGQFGSLAFNGNARWLQVEVCNDPGCASSTTLSPRQPLTGTPYSLGPWQTNGSHLYFSGGNVGIGTSTPGFPLSFSPILGDKISLWSDAGNPGGHYGFGIQNFLLQIHGDANVSDIGFGWGTSNSFTETMRVKGTGNVGIGTTAPAARLDVRGDVRLGTSGQYFASGGEENLRMMRGIINSDGSAPVGCCFSVGHPSTGTYDIDFTTDFSGTVAVTATPTAGGVDATISLVEPWGIRILTRDSSNNTAINAGFHFIVMGPR